MMRNSKFNSFLGKAMYDHLVGKKHFLRCLNELIDWVDLSAGIFKVYKGGFRLGAAVISPVTMLKMLLLSYLYNLSDRDTERLCNDSVSFKYFIELALDQAAPDHSSLSVFRDRILKYYGNARYFEQLFGTVVKTIAQHPEIKFGSSQIIDATHIEAKVKAVKNESDANSGDADAQWGCKGSEKRLDSQGQTVAIPKYFFGYKKHSSIENRYRFLTSSLISSGEKHDGAFFQNLAWHDILVRGFPEGYYADKGYDDGEHHVWLNQLDLADGINLRDFRLKDEPRYAIWKTITATNFYQRRKQERYKIEATFGDQKNQHGLRRCRYLGLIKTTMQCYLTDSVYNLKKLIKVLYGLSPQTVTA